MTKQMQYTNPRNGKVYPLFEADYDQRFKVFRTDQAKSVQGDNLQCIGAHGLRRLPNCIDAEIGSGKHAYVTFGPTNSRPYEHTLHFIIPDSVRRAVDIFDKDKKLKFKWWYLKAPSESQTKQAASAQKRQRYREAKSGVHPVRHRTRPIRKRRSDLGVSHRAKAQIQY